MSDLSAKVDDADSGGGNHGNEAFDKEKASSSHEVSAQLLPGLTTKEKDILAEILSTDDSSLDSSYTPEEEKKCTYSSNLCFLFHCFNAIASCLFAEAILLPYSAKKDRFSPFATYGVYLWITVPRVCSFMSFYLIITLIILLLFSPA